MKLLIKRIKNRRKAKIIDQELAQINIVISLQRVLMKLKGKGAVIVEITSL
jgi:hypothetical protein